MLYILILIILNVGTSEQGEGVDKHRDRDQLGRLAAHDERARKHGYEHKMRRIELAECFADVVA